MGSSIVIDHLTKIYPGTQQPALDSLSLQVAAGEVYGFLGANGAGKSTTIRLLLNFLQPSAGGATIMGLDSVRDSAKVMQHVGYLSGDVALPLKVTGKELLDHLSDLHGGHKREYRREVERRFEADVHKPIGSLSKGNRQKIGIIQALMHQPEVLILDEPTSGLDPLMQEVFYDYLRQARDGGVAVFMSSHNLAEAQRVCDRVGIIKHGKLIREQAIEGTTTLDKPLFRLTLTDPTNLAKLKKAKGLKFVSAADGTVLVQATDSIQAALTSLSAFDLRDIRTEQLNLEDEFLEFYGDNDA